MTYDTLMCIKYIVEGVGTPQKKPYNPKELL